MSDALKEKTLRWIHDAHQQLASAARAGHARDGRGCLVVEANREPGTTQAAWFSLEDVAADDPVVEQLRHMVRTYDPSRQFVVSVTLEGEAYGLNAKVRLQSPLIVENPSDAVN